MNNLLLAAALVTLLVFGVSALILAALSRHKKSATGPLMLSGARGRVHHALTPTGAVIVHGELWPAHTTDGQHLPANTNIRVVGASGNGLEVIATDEKRQF